MEVLSIRALKAHNKAAYDAARYASKAAARALNALIPSGEPPELSAKLTAAQHEADAAAAIANGPNKIVLRVSALVPQSTNGAVLSKPRTVLNTILGVELLKPFSFRCRSHAPRKLLKMPGTTERRSCNEKPCRKLSEGNPLHLVF